MKILKAIAQKTIFKFIIIPICLLSIWFFASLLTDPYASISTLEYPYSSSILKNVPRDVFLRGNKISGNFIAEKDNLGIISLKIYGGFSDIPGGEDILDFRIKEEGAKEWYYQNRYRVGAIREEQFVVFGFPKINSSKSKKYTFEVVSRNGNRDNALIFSKDYPSVYIRYIYNFKNILKEHNIPILFSYIKDKFYTILIDPRSFFYSLLFLLPFVFYISLTILNKILNSYLESIVILFILLDIIQTKFEVYAFAIGILGFWAVIIKRNKINYHYHLLLAFIFLMLAVILQFTGLMKVATRSSLWGFYFFVIASIQIFNIVKKEFTGKKK